MFTNTTRYARFKMLLLILGSAHLLAAQSAYFQQIANFEIIVELDDKKHQLRGQWLMDYENHSPDTLDFLYIHLWPNAYKNRSTAFARQMLEAGNTSFYFATEEAFGFIDSLNFQHKEKPLTTAKTPYGPDVIKLILNEPLLPDGKIRITSPFRLQFPSSFSRLGHIGQSYQVTQWYPKPAVYDTDGWHPMPYLDYGEYYSEFGHNYDVYITLPENYVVGATGELRTTSELSWLKGKAMQTSQQTWLASDPNMYTEPSFPPSSTQNKTIHYRANWVHDFAWFADKRFHVLHDTIQLSSNHTVDAWSYFTDQQAHLWQHSLDYIKRSTRFYSDNIGPYAYPQVSAVQSALSAGAGMEYPMITVIGLETDAHSLDHVITHEVGHNWFYGILASNERDHPWMDEGFNSYYDHRYDQQYYGNRPLLPRLLSAGAKTDLDELGYRYYGCQYRNQAPDTPSGQLRFYNYWVGAYGVPAKALTQLEDYWGRDRFDQAMKAYYREWQFKHPGPEDVQASLEKAGDDDLDWLFQGFIQSTEQQDYHIWKLEQGDTFTLQLRNNGTIPGPYPIMSVTEQGDTSLRWHPGFTGEYQIGLPNKNYRQISLDPDQVSLEMYRNNNHWHKGLGKWNPPQLRLFTGLKNEAYTGIFVLPLPAYNEDDGTLLGLVLHNRGMLPGPFEWYAAPLYGFLSKSLNGSAGLRGRVWQPKDKRTREVTAFATVRSFHHRTFDAEQVALRYLRTSIGTDMTFHASPGSKWIPSAGARHIRSSTDELEFSIEGDYLGTSKRRQKIYDLHFQLERDWVLSPSRLSLTLEHATYTDDFDRTQRHNKLLFEGRGKLLYQQRKAVYWRFFAGFFLSNSLDTYTPPQAFSLFDRGADDYRFDNLYFGRSATTGVAARQLGLRAGGFRAPVPASFGLGRSNKQMISFNTSADLPFTPEWLPLKPYLDAAVYAASTFSGDQNKFLWNGGLALEWLDGQIGVYVPLAGSPEITDRLKEQGNLGQRIGFRLLLTELAPWNWMDKLTRW